MAFQKIDARTILTTSTPQVAMYPDKPEPARVEDRKLDRAALRKKFKADAGELEEIIALPGFPSAGKRTVFGGQVTLIWSEGLVDRWVEDQRALAAKITRLLG